MKIGDIVKVALNSKTSLAKAMYNIHGHNARYKILLIGSYDMNVLKISSNEKYTVCMSDFVLCNKLDHVVYNAKNLPGQKHD